MASTIPTTSLPTGTSFFQKQHQSDVKLVAAVTKRLQAQVHYDGQLPPEARGCLEKLIIILAALKGDDDLGFTVS